MWPSLPFVWLLLGQRFNSTCAWLCRDNRHFTKQWPKLGQHFNPTTCICICSMMKHVFLFNRKNSIVAMLCWVQQRTDYRTRCAKYLASSWGTMLKKRHLKTNVWSFIFGTAFWVRLGVKLAFFSGVQKYPENGAFLFPILKWPHEAQNHGLQTVAKIYFFGRDHPHFCIFGWCAWILQKTDLLKVNRILLKPLKMSCQNGEAKRCNFCTGGSEISHLGSDNKMVPIDVSFHCTSFPIHLQEDKENCLIVLPFHFLDNKSHSKFFMIAFLLCNGCLCFSWFC